MRSPWRNLLQRPAVPHGPARLAATELTAEYAQLISELMAVGHPFRSPKSVPTTLVYEKVTALDEFVQRLIARAEAGREGEGHLHHRDDPEKAN